MLLPTNNNRIRPTGRRQYRTSNRLHICSIIVVLLPLLAYKVAAELRGDSFERKSYSTTPSNWVDFSFDASSRSDQGIVIVDDTIGRRSAHPEVKWRNLGTGSHVSIGISDMIMGKGKGKGGSSSKASSSSSKGSSDCNNIFAHDSGDSGKGGKGKGGGRGGRGSGSSSSKSGNTGKGGYSGKGSRGSGSKGGCNDDIDAPTPTSSGDGFPSPTPPAVPGFPIFSEEPVAPSNPTRSPSTTDTESPVMVPTPIREPTSDGRCTVGSDGLFGSQLGLSEETEFAYQATVNPSVTAAELDLDILQRVERAMAPLVLEQLFNRCSPSDGSATERMTGQRLRKLQSAEIEGWSTKPSDIVIQDGKFQEFDI